MQWNSGRMALPASLLFNFADLLSFTGLQPISLQFTDPSSFLKHDSTALIRLLAEPTCLARQRSTIAKQIW